MKVVNIHEAKTHLSQLLKRVAAVPVLTADRAFGSYEVEVIQG
jgi:antitoxin (DNA-binding transcriptional repressor) of toxin-antitoxin stability system